MITRSRIDTLLWYAGRRDLWPTLAPLLRRTLFPHRKERSWDEATAICRTEAVSTGEAIGLLTGSSAQEGLHELFPDVMAAAARRCEGAPIKMGGGGDIDLLHTLAEHVRAIRVLETGVAYGWSSLAILLSITKRDNALLISTDMPYAKSGNEPYVGIAVPDELRPCWRLIRKPDRSGIQEAVAQLGTIDLCHYDSDKSYQGRMFAYPLLWAALRPGGFLISDDIQDNIAFFEFADGLKLPRVVLKAGGKFVGVVQKPQAGARQPA